MEDGATLFSELLLAPPDPDEEPPAIGKKVRENVSIFLRKVKTFNYFCTCFNFIDRRL